MRSANGAVSHPYTNVYSVTNRSRSFAKTFETLILELDVIRKSKARIEGFSHHYLSKSLGFSHLEKLIQVQCS